MLEKILSKIKNNKWILEAIVICAAFLAIDTICSILSVKVNSLFYGDNEAIISERSKPRVSNRVEIVSSSSNENISVYKVRNYDANGNPTEFLVAVGNGEHNGISIVEVK